MGSVGYLRWLDNVGFMFWVVFLGVGVGVSGG